MGLGDLAGRARVNIRNPEAMGQCDRDGVWYPLSRLFHQFQWAGAELIDTGFLVCQRCLDIPQEQNRVLILPPDPVPRANPRPSQEVTGIWPIGVIAGPTTPFNQGFTQYVIGSTVDQNYPTSKSDVLSAIAAVTGIPIPGALHDRSIIFTAANTTQALMGANGARDWLLIYNPTQAIANFNLDTAVWGLTTNLAVGPGQAWFWADAQGLSATTKNAITAINLTAGVPLFAWESP